jgi:hypothetical protein
MKPAKLRVKKSTVTRQKRAPCYQKDRRSYKRHASKNNHTTMKPTSVRNYLVARQRSQQTVWNHCETNSEEIIRSAEQRDTQRHRHAGLRVSRRQQRGPPTAQTTQQLCIYCTTGSLSSYKNVRTTAYDLMRVMGNGLSIECTLH